MDVRNFIIENIVRLLEYLKQNPLYVYTRRSVDAYLAAYALVASMGETAQVAVADWPPRAGICIGFKCDGFYITERGVGIDDKFHASGFTSISSLVASIITSISPLDEGVHKALYIGHYSWSVDYCDYKCPLPPELARGDEQFAVVFPLVEEYPLGKALSLSTLPLIPGVTGREFDLASLPADFLAVLDWALGVVASEGFHTAILDKAIRHHSPAIRAATLAEKLEADLAGFVNRELETYVASLAESFYNVVKRVKDGVVPLPNPFYVYKLPPYLSYYLKLSNWVALRYETTRGYIAALVPPHGQNARLRKIAEELSEIGQVLEFPTHVIVYIEVGRYADFVRGFERLNEES
ncbi:MULTISPECIES: hypothetical protein [Pyrobaculum]|uniref:Uncharacterized protein n=2 Tax=Pyrobaculum arsenaticum TaxID=121277 RepID=A4WMA3_PYRAR|nr:hypothetical protein [Pyrobaculum arsenaticum]ABP51520.1 conserved hypothetical protein [Pyrobaculum arsenaticum DSM 13514]MCY0890998.1 hypothetical protein [Pyrobaculum arsenaticum]NYR16511.1 hypothetical protein [Pyrobaculum arsenaticum]